MRGRSSHRSDLSKASFLTWLKCESSGQQDVDETRGPYFPLQQRQPCLLLVVSMSCTLSHLLRSFHLREIEN
ncbi:hypothetical protein AAY473_013713 [Plecturocebus cupreus]